MAKEPSSRPGCFPLLMNLLRYWWVAALAAALVAVVILVKKLAGKSSRPIASST